jgi:hypothetical protein
LADAVATQILENGSQWFVAKFTSLSDGTGESAVTKLDPTSGGPMGVIIQGNTLYPGTHLKIMEMKYNVTGMTLQIDWDASTDVNAWFLQGYGRHNFRQQGGLFVPQSAGAPVAGATGKVLFTTLGAGGGSSYTVDIWCKKDIVQ